MDENELIDALTSEFSLDTPTLNIDCRSIEQYEDTPEIRDVFGDRFDAPVNVYSVAIPFSGDAAIFTYRPSRNDYKSTAGDDL